MAVFVRSDWISSPNVAAGMNRAARALRMAAKGCHHARHALGAFYRRIQARAGAAKAVVATARKMAERVWRHLRYGEKYVCQRIDAYEAACRARAVKGLTRRAVEPGYRLELMATQRPEGDEEWS